MGANKRIMSDQRKMLSCIIKNQIVIMETLKYSLPYEHLAIHGDEYPNKLKDRIAASKNIL